MVYDTVWEVYINVGDNAFKHGDFDLAEKMFQAAWQESKLLENGDSDIGNAVSNLAQVYQRQQRYTKVEILFERLIAVYSRIFGKQDPRLCPPMNRLAEAFVTQKKFKEAERLYKRCVIICENSPSAASNELVPALLNLAYFYMNRGRTDKARDIFKRVHELKGDIKSPLQSFQASAS